MIRFRLPALAAALVLSLLSRATAQDPAPAPLPAPAAPTPAESPAQSGFKVIFNKISERIAAGAVTEDALVKELAEFDELIARFAANKDDDVAMIAFMKARLYLEVFENLEKASALLKQLKADYPNTEIGRNIDDIVTAIDRQVASATRLKVGQLFPDFDEKDLDGNRLAVSALKGKVVLVDFWATWCGPCVAELPHVLAAYEKFKDKGFEIVGISLDKDRDALTSFIKTRRMTWPQYFDGLGWDNKLSNQYEVTSIPATFLLDRAGNIIAKDLRGDALEKKLAELLGE